jgi:drug/metabolite transporter (DMT)-like permease
LCYSLFATHHSLDFMSPRTATFTGFIAILLWSMLALLTTATSGLPPFQVTAITFLIGGGLGLLIVALTGRLALLRQSWPAMALGVGGLFFYHALYFAALKLAPPVEASLIAYLWPLLIVIFSGLLPGQRLRLHHVIGALTGFSGVLVLALGKGFSGLNAAYVPGYLLACGCALVWAGYSVLSRRMADVPTQAVAGFCLVTAMLAVVCHLAFERYVAPDAMGWLALAALGIGPVGLAFFVWDIGMKQGDVPFLGVASYAAPVLSTLILVLTGHAPASWLIGLSCLLIMLGALVASWDDVKKAFRHRA